MDQMRAKHDFSKACHTYRDRLTEQRVLPRLSCLLCERHLMEEIVCYHYYICVYVCM